MEEVDLSLTADNGIVVISRSSDDHHRGEILVDCRPSDQLNGKVRVLGRFAGSTFKLPLTVCVKLPSAYGPTFKSDGFLRDCCAQLFFAACRLLLMNREKSMTSHSKHLSIVIRTNSSSSELRFPALSQLTISERSDLRAETDRIADQYISMLHYINVENQAISDSQATSIPDEILIQIMSPTMTVVGDAIGWIWTRSDATSSGNVSGLVKVVGSSHRSEYCAFSDWALEHALVCDQLSNWVHAANAESVYGYRICFGYSREELFLHSVHDVSLGARQRWELAGKFEERGLIHKDEKLLMLLPSDFDIRSFPSTTGKGLLSSIAKADIYGNLTASGRLACSHSQIEQFAKGGEPVIFATNNLQASDISFFGQLTGIITRLGGPASHFVVLARANGIAVSVVSDQLRIGDESDIVTIGTTAVRVGAWITIEEPTATVYCGKTGSEGEPSSLDKDIRKYASEIGTRRVLVNADTAAEAKEGFERGASGVGLCRSENHLVRSKSALDEFIRWLFLREDNTWSSMPKLMRDTMEKQLYDLLLTAKGRRVHYRLFDLHLSELLPTPGSQDSHEMFHIVGGERQKYEVRLSHLREIGSPRGNRGCRWGLDTSFYRDQLRFVANVVDELSSCGHDVDIAILVPMVSHVRELEAVRNIYEIECVAKSKVKSGSRFGFGCMIETPLACITAHHLCQDADIVCFGTNDLTENVWAVSRNSHEHIISRWIARGQVGLDPFAVIDQDGVGILIKDAICAVRRLRPNVELVVCGEHASDPGSAVWFLKNGVDFVSCRASAVNAVSCAIAASQATVMSEYLKQSFRAPISSVARFSDHVQRRIRYSRFRGSGEYTQLLAKFWAHSVGQALRLPRECNWKFFKRNLVQRWFGEWEYRRFLPVWNSEDVVSYISKLRQSGSAIRYSVFPDSISCHAESKVIAEDSSLDKVFDEINTLPHDCPLEVFLQQSNSNLCFRAVYWGDYVDIEAGLGQAMYVFEAERGRHNVLQATIRRNGGINYSKRSSPMIERRLESGLDDLLDSYASWIFLRLWDMSNSLGVDWLAIEGYYNPEKKTIPFVCDLDLPMDLAFNQVG